MTDNSRTRRRRLEVISLEAGDAEAGDRLDRLRTEVDALRASRRRLVMAADDDRRSIERELHNGLQQHLTALAVNVQLARRLADSDADGVKALLEQLERDVQAAVDVTAQLAQRIHPPLLEPRGLAAALRAAAASAGVAARIDVAEALSYPAEEATSVYSCWREALDAVDAGRGSITVRNDGSALQVEIIYPEREPEPGLERLCDRVEALGGRLTMTAGTTTEIHVSCALPLPR